MATKMSNKHLYTILLNANKYYTPDIYVALVHISVEIKDKDKNERFLIQTGDNKRTSLIKVLSNHLNINRQTIVNCLSEIEGLGILMYNEELFGWELIDMISMLQEGYTEIKDILLEDDFSSYKLREKKLLLYMCHLSGTKGFNDFNKFKGVDFIININRKDSMWRKILRTNSSYYAKYTINKFLAKVNDKIDDLSIERRKREFKPLTITQFIFYCNAPTLKQRYEDDIWIKIKYVNELEMIKQYARETEVTLSKQKMYQLAHGIGVIHSWIIKEYVCRCIIKKYIAIQKYKSREDIKSLPAYTATIIKYVIEEYSLMKKGQDIDIDSLEIDAIAI